MDDSTQRQHWSNWLPLLCLILALAAVAIVYFSVQGDPLNRLTIIVGYVILILLFFIGLIVIIAMATGRIDLSLLLAESGGGASMSRFQLLIFTFLIAFSLFMMVVSSGKPMKFPAIPSEILTLLGISASTYAVSKGIQASNPGLTKTGTQPGATTTPPKPTPAAEQTPNTTT